MDNDIKNRNVNLEIDPISGLYVKDAFCKHASEFIEERPNETLLLVTFAIDNLDLFQDNYGTMKTEELLITTAVEWRKQIYDDCILGIQDDNNFVYCCAKEYFTEKNINAAIANVQSKIEVPFSYRVKHGVYEINDRSVSVKSMCDYSKMALKRIKDSYQIRVSYFTEDMFSKILLEQRIINEMEQALDENQFVVFVQPQFNQWDMSISGAEALVRWQHPALGLLSPDKFIPVLERTGFIAKVDMYMLEKVCEYQRKLLDRNLEIMPISINLSRVGLLMSNICEIIEKIVDKYRLQHKYINLEVTESAFVMNRGIIIDAVKTLKTKGFRVEMDDFGSGYSSLNSLKNIPVDAIKLDLDFLNEDDNERSGQIISAVVHMAHNLGIKAISEGVENETQANFLKSIGCFYVQGYYFGKPMPLNSYTKLLTSKKHDLARNLQEIRRKKNHELLNMNATTDFLMDDSYGAAGIIEYDGLSVNFIRLNDGLYELFQIGIDDGVSIFTHPISDYFDEENWDQLIGAIAEAVSTEYCSSCDVLLRFQTSNDKSNENKKWIRVNIAYVRSYNNRHILHMRAEDIDEFRKASQGTEEITLELNAVLDMAKTGILTVEYSDNEFKILHMNEIAATMFGYTKTEYLEAANRNPYCKVHPDDVPRLLREVNNMQKPPFKPFEMKLRILCKDGSYLSVVCLEKTYPEKDGKLLGIISLADMTNEDKRDGKLTKRREPAGTKGNDKKILC